MDVERHSVRVHGEEVTLTFKEFSLLKYLLENKGFVLTRDQLLQEVWGYDYEGETRTVDVHIRTLRQKLGPAGSLIETVRESVTGLESKHEKAYLPQYVVFGPHYSFLYDATDYRRDLPRVLPI